MDLLSDYKSKREKENSFQVKIESYISRGIKIFGKNAIFFIFYTIIYLACLSVPVIGFIISMPLVAGFYLSAHYLESGKTLHFEDMFDGFKHFAGLFLFAIVSAFFIILGLIALIIPGIYLLVGYIFTPFFIVFEKMDFWEAMERSRKLVHKEWLSFFVFLIVLFLFNILGLLALGIGVLLTIPISFCAIYAAFDDIVGLDKIENY